MKDGEPMRPVRQKCPRCHTWSTPVLRVSQPWFCIYCAAADLTLAALPESTLTRENDYETPDSMPDVDGRGDDARG